jgi:hypothetical protein
MVERIVRYVPKAETVLNLTDGSFIDPEIARQWMQAVQMRGKYRYRNMGGHGWFDGLGGALETHVKAAIDRVASDRADIYKGKFIEDDFSIDIEATLQGELDPFESVGEDIIMLRAYGGTFTKESAAEKFEAQALQEQAFVSYRLAELMVQTIKRQEEFEKAQSVAEDAQQIVQEIQRTI